MKNWTAKARNIFSSKSLEVKLKKDIREYDRLVLFKPGEKLKSLPTVFVEMAESEQALAVFDMSLTGIAFQSPPDFKIDLNGTVALKLHIEKNVFDVKGFWARQSENVVAIKISNLDAHGRTILNQFLDQKLIAFHLISVDKQFFDSKKNIDVWLRGPNETDIIIWTKDREKDGEIDEISRFEIRYLHTSFGYNGQNFTNSSHASSNCGIEVIFYRIVSPGLKNFDYLPPNYFEI